MKPLREGYGLASCAALSLIALAVAAYTLAQTGFATCIPVLSALVGAMGLGLLFKARSASGSLEGRAAETRTNSCAAEKHYIEVLGRIIKVVESRDRYWSGHSENVGRLAGMIARNLGMSSSQCEQMILAGQLHDIGLLAVPESVILNHSRFGIEDYRCVQTHSVASHDVLKPLEMLGDVLPAIRSHHEKFNGTGYPDGLKGEDIPLGGRILAVADAYDAMTHDRPHRQAMSPAMALREMRRCSPAGFDPACVDALAEALNIAAVAAKAESRQLVPAGA